MKLLLPANALPGIMVSVIHKSLVVCGHLAFTLQGFFNAARKNVNWLIADHPLAPKDLTKNFIFSMMYTNEFDCLVYEMFLFTSKDLLSMYNLTQFVLMSLMSFSFVFIFACFYCPFTPANRFILLTCMCLYSLFNFTIHSLMTKVWSCFTVDFYR